MSSEIRLQKFLSSAGIASRRKAETFITDGRVWVNGKQVTTMGTKVHPLRDVVTVDGQRVKAPNQPVHLMIYKPVGTICSEDDPHHRDRVHDLLPKELPRLFSVGRLDYNTEGVLLFTTDGSLAETLTRPSTGVPKIYQLKIQGPADDHLIRRFNEGIRLDDGRRTRPAPTEVLKKTQANTWYETVLTEGRNRQIHRMAEACGKRVVRLKRVAFGPVTVGRMRPGQCRPLTDAEIAGLQEYSRKR